MSKEPKKRTIKKLELNKETIIGLDEAGLALGGGKPVKKTVKPVQTLGPTCDPPTVPVNCGPSNTCLTYCHQNNC